MTKEKTPSIIKEPILLGQENMKIRKLFLLFLIIPLVVFICSKIFAQGTWNNDIFLNQSFWDASPTTGEIITALFGDGSGWVDTTAYTSWRATNCITWNLTVTGISPGTDTLPETLSDNTIYVLESWTYITTATRNMWNCTAIVGKGTVTVQANYSTDTRLLYSYNTNWILDNLKLDRNIWTTPGMDSDVIVITTNTFSTINNIEAYNGYNGIYINVSTGTYIYNSQAYNNAEDGIYVLNSTDAKINSCIASANGLDGIASKYSSSGEINNYETYNNLFWIGIIWWTGIQINNGQSYNNRYQGIFIYESMNNQVNNNQSYNNSGYGIFFSWSTNNQINNSQSFNNADYGIYLYTSDSGQINNSQSYYNGSVGINIFSSSNVKINTGNSYNNNDKGMYFSSSNHWEITNSNSYQNNGAGIYFQSSNYGTVNNSESFNNTGDGIRFYSSSSYGTVNNSETYNNNGHGILFDISDYGTINNSQAYNNLFGIRFVGSGWPSLHGAINNSQSYNNWHQGILLSFWVNYIINNCQIYNNADNGINFGTNSKSWSINNSQIYNNAGYGIELTDSAINTTYYGNNKIFNNEAGSIDDISGNFIQGNNRLMWRDNGLLDFSPTMSRDYITNPMNILNEYFLSRSWNYTDLIWPITAFTGTSGMQYSYGSGILTQIQPVIYVGTILIASWSYTTGNFIWSSVPKITGTILWIDTSIYNSYTTIITGITNSPSSMYNIYGNITNFKYGINSNTNTWIIFSSWIFLGKVIMQVYDPTNYFAMHFQRSTALNQCGDWNNNQFITWAFRDSNPSDNKIICALYGDGSGWTDSTAYTKYRGTNTCDIGNMSVIYLSWWGLNILPTILSDNTIYVLSWWFWTVDTRRNMSNCSAIIGKGDVTIQSAIPISPQSTMINANGTRNRILDNLKLDRNYTWTTGLNSAINIELAATSMTINNLQVYNASTSYGIQESTTGGSYLIINNTQVYSGYMGIRITSPYSIITNSQTFNVFNVGFEVMGNSGIIDNCQAYNSFVWVRYKWANGNVLSNSQSYNNNYGVSYSGSSNNIITNSQIYNNNSICGLCYSSWDSNSINNTRSYNNWGQGISLPPTTNIKYYGFNRIFNNWTNLWWNTANFITGSANDFAWLGWNTGTIDTTPILSRDYLTNPKNASSTYNMARSGSFPSLGGTRSLSWFLSILPITYSYGSWILTQAQPVIYLTWSAPRKRWSFVTGNYIWWNTAKITGDLIGIWAYNGINATVTGIVNSPATMYNIFWDLTTSIYGIYSNVSTWITFSWWITTGKIIIQLYDPVNYFATHFQRTTSIDTVSPSIPTLVSPASGTLIDTWTVNLLRSGAIDTGGWISGYFYQVSTWLSFTTFITSGFTTNTGIILPNLTDGTYYRQVAAIDTLGNTGGRSSTWNFVINAHPCLSWWNNDNYLTTWFRNNNPNDSNIICALYGNGTGDTTAYTQDWSWRDDTQCTGMIVIYTGNLIASTLQNNTIYVLTGTKSINSSTINMANCSSIISNQAMWTIFYSSNQVNQILYGYGKQYVIVDNIATNGSWDGNGWSHTWNVNGIYFHNSSNSSINNIQAYNNRNGVEIQYGSYININNSQAYNNGWWIALESWSNSTISNVQVYNNPQIGIWIRYTWANNSINSSQIYNNGRGIQITYWWSNGINDVQVYNNANIGINLWSWTNKNSINNAKVYNHINSVGIYISASWTNNNINNTQTYNNGRWVVIGNWSYNNVINNTQAYNNTVGILLTSASNNTINNTQTYNDNRGFAINTWSNNNINNLQAYNCSDDGIGNYYVSSNNKYYGKIALFNNWTNSTWIRFTWTNSDFPLLGRTSGTIITTRAMSWDYITNPLNTVNKYMLSRSWTFTSLIGQQTFTGTSWMQYSYGSKILTQAQPVMYSWVDLILSWTFDSTKYIWSDTTRFTWNLLWTNPITNKTSIIATGIANNVITDTYNLLGDIFANKIWQNIYTSTWISLITGDGNKRIITQIYSSNYFATHFENDSYLDQTPPTATIIYSPISWTRTNSDILSTLTGYSEPLTGINFTWHTFTWNWTFTFSFSDLAGNTGSATAIVTRIDKNPPTATILYSPISWTRTNSNILATLTGYSETLTGINSTWHLFTGNWTFTFIFSDLAGNTGTATSIVWRIDKESPTFWGVQSGSIYGTGVSINFTDNTVTAEATLNGSPYYGDPITANWTYIFIVTDAAGNSTWATFTINTTLPTVSIGYISSGATGMNGWITYFKWLINIRANVSDSVWLSGSTCQYTTGASRASATYHTSYCEAMWLAYTQDVGIRFRIYNLVGNLWIGDVGTYIYDETPPTWGSFVINNNNIYTNSTNVVLNINCPIDAGIGGEEITYRNGTGQIFYTPVFTGCSTTKPRILSGGDGVKIVYMTDKDALENISSGYTDSIILDTQAPTATVIYNISGSLTNQNVLATLTGYSEPLTGINATWHLFTGNGVFTFSFSDLAGNTGTIIATVTRIDKTPPTATVIYAPTSGTLTSGNVLAMLTGYLEPLTGINATWYLFIGNWMFRFTFSDLAGNTWTTIATVNRIDKTKPTAIITYSPTSWSWTSGDVIATITINESWAITNNGWSTQFIFTGNTGFTFAFQDIVGNTWTATATVNRIDKIPPTFSWATSGVTYTSGIVINLADNNPWVTATINGNTYMSGTSIAWNGTYTIIIRDVAGNTTGATFTIFSAVCGNGIVEWSELYDDGILNGTPGHSNTSCNGLIGQSSNGWWWSRLVKDSCPNGDFSPSFYDFSCGSQWSHGSATCNTITQQNEFTDAYDRAYNLWITTVAPICEANLDGKITRKQLAKMMTEFTVQIIGKQPNNNILCSFADTKDETPEMKFYMKIACQLGLMGRESDGRQTKRNFDPNNYVTRAEFGTVLSRLIFANKYNTADSVHRYNKHLQILQQIQIMNDISKPTMKELRGYVLLMLKRSNEYINNNN